MLNMVWCHQVRSGEWPRQGPWTIARWRTRLVALLWGVGVLGLLWHGSPAGGAAAAGAAGHPPSQDMAEGLAAFQRGDFERAAARWEQAARGYAEAGHAQARSVALTQLARAYEALGHDDAAEDRLRTARELAGAAGDRAQLAAILGHLGSLAVARGDLAAAERLVGDALVLAHALGDAARTATILHTRGNLLMARQQPHEALAVYRDSAAMAEQAQQAGIAGRALAHAAMAALQEQRFQTAEPLLEEALAHLRRVEPSHETAYDWLLIGRAYQRLAAADPALWLRAADLFREAAGMAQALQDPRALSYAWGYLGRLYEEDHRHAEALSLTRRAALAAQQVYAPESLYLWQWQTGRLLRALGDPQPAIEAYERAVATVQAMRAAWLRSVGRGPTDFRTSLGPLYFELADLLLRQAAALEGRGESASPQYARYLQRARDTVEQFKTAELREYFGDECVDAARPRTTALEHVSHGTAVVYPILLPDRTELLVSLPTGLTRVTLAVAGPQLAQRVTILRNAIEERDPPRSLQHAQTLYRWLIQPLEAELAAQHVHTLVFVPDGALRRLPLAALHDGQRFLVEKYALAITPSLALTEPRPLPQDRVQVLAAGVASAVAGFPPLPRVPEELQGLLRLYGGTLLLDHAFGPTRLDATLRQGSFDIVHLASHGHFAPETAQSFLLTAEGPLSMARLAQIVGRLRFRDRPLELLTLSACDTAQGDDRAALGLAGVAVQAGARSAVATLWLVADDAAAVLMTAFYRHLRDPTASKARALQQAQLHLLRQPQSADPFFWAAFLLINNWL